jgi:hypothetical protein
MLRGREEIFTASVDYTHYNPLTGFMAFTLLNLGPTDAKHAVRNLVWNAAQRAPAKETS